MEITEVTATTVAQTPEMINGAKNNKKIKVTRYNNYKSDGLNHFWISFIPLEDINCNPPYIKGKPDGRWVAYNPKIWVPKTHADFEFLTGIACLSFK